MTVDMCQQTKDRVTYLRRELTKLLLRQCKHCCPVTGERIGVNTCVVLVDEHGDPWMVCSQAGWARQTPENIEWLAGLGLFVDEGSIRAEVDD